MNSSPSDRGLSSPARNRDPLGAVALGAAVVSFLGFATLVIGHLVDPGSFNNTKDSTAANNVAFFAYVFGVLIALILGGAVWFYAHRAGRATNRSAAALAATYGVTFLVIGIVAGALGA